MLFRLPKQPNRIIINGEVWIAPTAVIIGGIKIDNQSRIGYNSVLRGDLNQISIGCLTSIDDECYIETGINSGVTIGNGVKIGYNVTLNCCLIQDGVFIGDGAIVQKGACIEEDSIIKPGTIIYEGQHIPARAIVEGSPASVSRYLTNEEISQKQKYWHNLENRLLNYYEATKNKDQVMAL
ncbi:MAG: gamma carbonic anhydrase family protein [Syntrophomonadaceae bacterium]|nr:gamma carbonic anhydrase family protein [Syntrophomonadaceae bacterium]